MPETVNSWLALIAAVVISLAWASVETLRRMNGRRARADNAEAYTSLVVAKHVTNCPNVILLREDIKNMDKRLTYEMQEMRGSVEKLWQAFSERRG